MVGNLILWPVTPEVASSSLVVPAITKSRGYVKSVAPFLLPRFYVSNPISNLQGYFQGIPAFLKMKGKRYFLWKFPPQIKKSYCSMKKLQPKNTFPTSFPTPTKQKTAHPIPGSRSDSVHAASMPLTANGPPRAYGEGWPYTPWSQMTQSSIALGTDRKRPRATITITEVPTLTTVIKNEEPGIRRIFRFI